MRLPSTEIRRLIEERLMRHAGRKPMDHAIGSITPEHLTQDPPQTNEVVGFDPTQPNRLAFVAKAAGDGGAPADAKYVVIELHGDLTEEVLHSALSGTQLHDPKAHAPSHKHGGGDEVATATPGANAIPKAGVGGKLAAGWVQEILAYADLTDDPVGDHEAAADPHSGYQKESEKDAADGYMGLDGSGHGNSLPKVHGSSRHSAQSDAEAIHDNVSGEIAALTEKGTPVSADLLVIEDSAASNAKKKVQVGNLPGGNGGGSSKVAFALPVPGRLYVADNVSWHVCAPYNCTLTYWKAAVQEKPTSDMTFHIHCYNAAGALQWTSDTLTFTAAGNKVQGGALVAGPTNKDFDEGWYLRLDIASNAAGCQFFDLKVSGTID